HRQLTGDTHGERNEAPPKKPRQQPIQRMIHTRLRTSKHSGTKAFAAPLCTIALLGAVGCSSDDGGDDASASDETMSSAPSDDMSSEAPDDAAMAGPVGP